MLTSINITTNQPCIKGKITRKQFKYKDQTKSTHPLQLIHSGICGPMQNASIGGSRYFVTFIDDYSRFTHVHFIKHKSDVFSVFHEDQALVTNKTGQTIGTLRSDGVGEYMPDKFEQYLCSEDNHHKMAVRYAPHQYGVAEKHNRTVCKAARSMIIESELSKSFWAEAVSTAVYVRNQVPTTTHKIMTAPYQLWYDHKPDISILQVFCSTAYAHIPNKL